MTTKIIPVLMSGGAGTRLWPLSRSERPKQFHRLGGEHSLIQDTALRLTGEASPRRWWSARRRTPTLRARNCMRSGSRPRR